MPDGTDMDANNKNKKSRFEFTLPRAEVDAAIEAGDVGSIVIPVEALEVLRDFVTFRKRGRATSQMEFKQQTLADMEADLGLPEGE